MLGEFFENFRRESPEPEAPRVAAPAPAKTEPSEETLAAVRPRRNATSGLHMKSYYASSVQAAVNMARRELGTDAMLVTSGRSAPENQALGEYEVVFAITPGMEPPAPRPARNGRNAASNNELTQDSPFLRMLVSQMADLKKQVASIRQARATSDFRISRLLMLSPQFADWYSLLAGNDLDKDLAHELLECVDARLTIKTLSQNEQPRNGIRRATLGVKAPEPAEMLPVYEDEALRRALIQEIDERFSIDPTLGTEGADPKVVVLVGPPGSGKTTTLVKLAVKYGLGARRPMQILTVDNYRIAAADQLRSYATILGVGFTALDTVNSLAQSIEEHKSKSLILVDSPGYSIGNLDHGIELARFLSSRPKIDTHLVLPASMKPADLSRAVDRFEVFKPRKLLFTKLDETASFGPIFGEASRTGKPISFLANGQHIPEDLEEAAKKRVIDLLLQPRKEEESRESGAAN